jgi:virginiamycin B lyase
MTTSGCINEFRVPTPSSLPVDITAGPDGALWFAEEFGNKIGRMTTSGTISEYRVPTPHALPFGITAGPDGALWFTEEPGNKVGRILPYERDAR